MKEKFTEKLQAAATEWFERTKPMRMCRFRMLQQYANGWYSGGENASRRPIPINLIDRGVQIIAPYLVANNPRVSISTKYGITKPGHKQFALVMELALASLFEDIKLSERTLRPLIIDSLFGMGITKTGVWMDGVKEMGDWLAISGQPYCDRVDFNDYIGDISARHRYEMMFEGNRYRLPLAVVTDSGLFKNYDNLVPKEPEERATDPREIPMQGHNNATDDDLRQTVELQDFYLPDEKVTITIPLTGYGWKVMRTVEWKGPETGPYDILSYKQFPESIVPIPPVYIWLDIHKTLNTMARKMSENCEREKSLGVYQLGADEDAQVIKDAAHGDLIGLANPETMKDITIGGFNPKSMEYLQYLEHQFAISYSNLYQLGGRGAQAKTLGQEQMMMTNATRALDDMAEQFHNFTRSVTKKLAYFMWQNPTKSIPVIQTIEGFDIEQLFNENTKQGEFDDYIYDIDVYSMANMNPEMRFQRLIQIIGTIVIPMADLAMQQGEYPLVGEIVKEVAKYLNVPNVDRWWKSAMPQEMQGMNQFNQQEKRAGNKSPGQLNDATGAMEASRVANLNQQQSSPRGGKPSPSNKGKQK